MKTNSMYYLCLWRQTQVNSVYSEKRKLSGQLSETFQMQFKVILKVH